MATENTQSTPQPIDQIRALLADNTRLREERDEYKRQLDEICALLSGVGVEAPKPKPTAAKKRASKPRAKPKPEPKPKPKPKSKPTQTPEDKPEADVAALILCALEDATDTANPENRWVTVRTLAQALDQDASKIRRVLKKLVDETRVVSKVGTLPPGTFGRAPYLYTLPVDHVLGDTEERTETPVEEDLAAEDAPPTEEAGQQEPPAEVTEPEEHVEVQRVRRHHDTAALGSRDMVALALSCGPAEVDLLAMSLGRTRLTTLKDLEVLEGLGYATEKGETWSLVHYPPADLSSQPNTVKLVRKALRQLSGRAGFEYLAGATNRPEIAVRRACGRLACLGHIRSTGANSVEVIR